MRIALIGDKFSKTEGGIPRYCHELLTGLIKKGLDVEVISPKSMKIPFRDVFNHAIRLPYIMSKKANDFDLVHATAPITALSFPLIKIAKVVTYHDLFSLLYRKDSISKHVIISAPLFLKIGKYADRIIAVSTQTRDEIAKYLKIPKEKIAVVNLGVDDRFRPFNKGEKDRDYYTIGYVGSLAYRKRVDYLIKAFYILKKKHPKLKVKLIIGGAKKFEYSKLIELVGKLNLVKDVEFMGFIPEDRLVEIYNSFDIFVLPSDWEGFGLPILEAQRCGVPVIIRENARIPREVAKCCVKVRSVEDMADKMYELLTDLNLRTKIIKERLEYSKLFTWKKTIEKTIKIYGEIL